MRNSRIITSRGGFLSSCSTGTIMTASHLGPGAQVSRRDAYTQRPVLPLCSYVAAYRFSHFSLVTFSILRIFIRWFSDGFRAAFAGADADAFFQGKDEDFAVADAALGSGAAGLHDGVDGRLDEVLVDCDLQLHLAEQLGGQFMAAVHLRLALLPAEALHVDDGQAEHLNL